MARARPRCGRAGGGGRCAALAGRLFGAGATTAPGGGTVLAARRRWCGGCAAGVWEEEGGRRSVRGKLCVGGSGARWGAGEDRLVDFGEGLRRARLLLLTPRPASANLFLRAARLLRTRMARRTASGHW